MPEPAFAPVPFEKLREWALFALEDWADVRTHDAMLRSFELRLVLAWLYSSAPGDRACYDAYWHHATRHIEVAGGAYGQVIKERAQCLRRELARIYAALGLPADEMHQRYREAVGQRNAWYARFWERKGRSSPAGKAG
jgi:hypothetical protein